LRAVGVTEFGGPEALRMLDIPEPHAGAGEVRIRVRAAAVNPTDTYLRQGAYAGRSGGAPGPHVPGMDAAGVLDEIGEGVTTDLAIGDHVMAMVLPRGSHGAYAEHVVVPFESVARAPAGASHAEACTLPMNGLTARLALDVLALRPGQTVAVTGAAGAFGGYVVQLAKADGLHVIADASQADERLVRDLGADVVLRRGDDLARRIRELAADGVDGVADGAVMNELIVPAARDGGTVASVRGFELTTERGVTVRPVWVNRYLREQARLDRLGRQVEDGVVTLRVAGVLPADRAAEAHRLLEAGGVRGRLVLEF
jgi:NADPH:quinone reductase